MNIALNRILMVDDEEDLRVLAGLALGDIGGFILEICSSGQEALDKVTAFQPDLILLDVIMPVMDGPATFTELKKLPEIASTPIFFLTAKTEDDEVAELLALGAEGVLAKPFDPMTLAETVREKWSQI